MPAANRAMIRTGILRDALVDRQHTMSKEVTMSRSMN